MPDQSHVHRTTASVEQRVDAIQAAFDERGLKPGEFIAVVKKKIGAAPASGTIAHLITFDAVFE